MSLHVSGVHTVTWLRNLRVESSPVPTLTRTHAAVPAYTTVDINWLIDLVPVKSQMKVKCLSLIGKFYS